MSNKQVKSRKGWQMLMLAVILIGFPGVSWYYLSKGFEYQLAARDQLRKTHQLQSYKPLNLAKGKAPESLMDKMYVVALIPDVKTMDMAAFGHTLGQLHEQFDRPKNIQFWTVFENRDANFVTTFCQEAALKDDDEQLIFWTANEPNFNTFTKQLGLNETELTDFGKMPQLVLVDDSLYIRRVFRSDLADEVKQLVEVTALLLPERSRPKAKVIRETEK